MKDQTFDLVFIQDEWFIVRLSPVVIIFRVALKTGLVLRLNRHLTTPPHTVPVGRFSHHMCSVLAF
jgi:hypothetical protein